MSIVTCPECKKEVSNTADKCPHCGAKLKMGMMAKAGIGLVALVGVFLLIGANTKNYEIAASESRQMCREAVKAGVRTHDQCEAKYREAIKRGQELNLP